MNVKILLAISRQTKGPCKFEFKASCCVSITDEMPQQRILANASDCETLPCITRAASILNGVRINFKRKKQSKVTGKCPSTSKGPRRKHFSDSLDYSRSRGIDGMPTFTSSTQCIGATELQPTADHHCWPSISSLRFSDSDPNFRVFFDQRAMLNQSTSYKSSYSPHVKMKGNQMDESNQRKECISVNSQIKPENIIILNNAESTVRAGKQWRQNKRTHRLERRAQLGGLKGPSSVTDVTLEGNPTRMEMIYRHTRPDTLALMCTQPVKRTRNSRVKKPRRNVHPPISNRGGRVSCNPPSVMLPREDIHIPKAETGVFVNSLDNSSNKGVCDSNTISCESRNYLNGNRKDSISARTSNFNVASLVCCPLPGTTMKQDKAVMSQVGSSVFRYCKTPEIYIRWSVQDRTQLRLVSTSKPPEIDTNNSRAVSYPTLKMALSDLTICRPGDRNKPGLLYSAKGPYLPNIHSLLVEKINWQELLPELAYIRLILPGLKHLKLVDVGISELTTILHLTLIERLDTLCISPTSGNPIVKKAGQFWRPFVIWALKDTLGFRELDEQVVTLDERMKAGQIFSSIGQHLLLHEFTTPVQSTAAGKENQETLIDQNSAYSPISRKAESILKFFSNPPDVYADKNLGSWSGAVETSSCSGSHQASCINQGNVNEIPRELYLSEDLVKRWTDMLKLGKICAQRQKNVCSIVEDELQLANQKLFRRAQMMDIWPPVLRQLVGFLSTDKASDTF
ncbi:hypothetical protein CSKR_106522 [Clonorchis sinensis]|uniref:Leucine-rich repeat-containing protein 49 n=2 Tax=Clonorchis sinensis TaxID=79923 RepID=A0A3R7EPQ4_CLOSI|nr:hypothetical protein CSKR_106522 [Clonorchis sinensis]